MLAQGLDDLEKLRAARDALDDLVRTFYMPIPDAEEFVIRTFDFVNPNMTIEDRAECYFFVMQGVLIASHDNIRETTDDGFSVKGLETETRVRKQVTDFWNSTSDDRQEYGKVLDKIIRRSPRDVAALADNLESHLRDFVMVPIARWEGSKLNITHRYCPLNIRGVMAYALVLLLDGTLDSEKYLKRCRLGSCKDFFWARSGGRPRVFCTDEHKAEFDRLSKRESEPEEDK